MTNFENIMQNLTPEIFAQQMNEEANECGLCNMGKPFGFKQDDCNSDCYTCFLKWLNQPHEK